jgi:xanthine dehydrogenase accessory factor
MFVDVRVLFKNEGDLATCIPARLWRSCFQVVKIELVQPSIIRLTVAFAEAVYTGEANVE